MRSTPYRFRASCAAISWIDRRSWLPEFDGRGQADYVEQLTVSREQIVREKGYRFAHLLEAWIDVRAGTVIHCGFTEASGMYRALSFAGIPSEAFPLRRHVQRRADEVTFTQLAGCRTRSPEVVAAREAASALNFLGDTLEQVLRHRAPQGVYRDRTQPFGERLGRGIVEQGVLSWLKITAFPPIWTELSLTIGRDGKVRSNLVRHSLFPSVCWYREDPRAPEAWRYVRQGYYDGVPFLREWIVNGWGLYDGARAGNPWAILSPRERK